MKTLLETMAYQNEVLSETIANVFVRILNRVIYDTADYPLDALEIFLNIKDNFSVRRKEWTLGVPILEADFK